MTTRSSPASETRSTAWHAPGANHNGLGFEHAGYSSQSAAQWDDPYSQAMLWRSARLLADKCAQYSIPAAWLSPADLLAGKRGITSHWNVTLAFRRSDHTDPGPGFPAARYVTWVRRVLATRKQPAGRYSSPCDGATSTRIRSASSRAGSTRPGEPGSRCPR